MKANRPRPNKGSIQEILEPGLVAEERGKYAPAKSTSSCAIIVLSNSLIQKGKGMQEKESEIVNWIKELEEKRGKLDLEIDELDQEIARIEWRITQLEEFKRKIEEEVIQIAQSEVIVERAELEMKTLAHLQGGRKEYRGEVTVDREFCKSLVSYLRSKLESAREKPSLS